MATGTNGIGSVTERVAGIGRLLGTLDQRLIEAFDTLDRVGEAAATLDSLAADGGDLVAELRARTERLDKKVRADMDELKGALLDKLAEIDVDELTARLDRLETSIGNIETAVTRMDSVLEGAVDAAPDFVTRRVRDASEEVAEELPGA